MLLFLLVGIWLPFQRLLIKITSQLCWSYIINFTILMVSLWLRFFKGCLVLVQKGQKDSFASYCFSSCMSQIFHLSFHSHLCHKNFHEDRLAFNTSNLPKYSFFHYSNYTFIAIKLKQKRTEKNIHKIKQLAWSCSSTFIGTMVVSDRFIILITSHCMM